MKKMITIILSSLVLISCGKEGEKGKDAETKQPEVLVQSQKPLYVERVGTYENDRFFERVRLPENIDTFHENFELLQFYVDDDNSSVNFHSRNFKVGYLSKGVLGVQSLKELEWKQIEETIGFNAHENLSFSFLSRYDGYPHLANDIIFIDMIDSHENIKAKIAVSMTCPEGKVVLANRFKCLNDTYKLEYKIFELIKL